MTIECECGAVMDDTNPLNPLGDVIIFHMLAGHQMKEVPDAAPEYPYPA